VLASNTALAEFLAGLPVELGFRARDPQDLARALRAVEAAGPEAWAAAGAELRRRVEAGHSLDSWADAVTRSVRELRRRPG
jgi:hypothetical protein